MADNNSPRFVVARYLQDYGYHQTLNTFITETDLPLDAAQSKPGDWGLEQIIREKNLYDQNLNFETDTSTAASGWSEPCPATPVAPEGANLANGLAVIADQQAGTIIASFVNNTAGFWDTSNPPKPTLGVLSTGRNILSLAVVKDRYFLSGQMDGSIAAHDLRSFKTLASVKAHSNYAVQVITTWDGENLLIATAGWDKKISIHLAPYFQPGSNSNMSFSETFNTIPTPHNVQSLLFARHPDTNELYLVYTIRDSIHLHYLHLTRSSAQDPNPYIAKPAGRQSLAPQQHSTWTSFTPAWLEASPIDPTLIAVATSHTPSMKLIITRLLFPSPDSSAPSQPQRQLNATNTPTHGTKDELAIKLVATTHAPQNDYSTPRCAWRPDGSGLWVSGDDGVIRGIDAETGKIARELKEGGHEPGSKIRALWAGRLLHGEEEREVLVSGGFDRRVLVWEVAR